MQVTPILVTCILVAVYGLVQPFKSTWANILETMVLCNLLFMLILQSTQSIRDTFFVFPPPTAPPNLTADGCSDEYSGIATITWFLLPLYYLPLFVLAILGAILVIYYIRYRNYMFANNYVTRCQLLFS